MNVMTGARMTERQYDQERSKIASTKQEAKASKAWLKIKNPKALAATRVSDGTF
jgi:hypothetical protein